MTLLASVTQSNLKKDNLILQSKSEHQHKIKIASVYKLILETLQKSECAPELIRVFISGNKLLLVLATYLISQSYHLSPDTASNEQLALKIKLYIERVRYRYLKEYSKEMEYFGETV